MVNSNNPPLTSIREILKQLEEEQLRDYELKQDKLAEEYEKEIITR